MATKTQTYGTTNSAVTYAYDAQGQLQSVTYPSGKVVSYQYSNGLVSGLLLDGQPLLSSIGYEPFGAVKTWRFGGNGNTVTRSYDLDGQLTSYTLANGVRNVTYAKTGNITGLIDPNQAANDQSYAYDALYRLNQTTALGSTESYQYDANGNRTLRTVSGVEFGYGNEATSNRLLSVAGPQALTNAYDAVGNIINDGTNAYTYNAANRLVAASAAQSQYAHNGLGQRVFKSSQGLGALPGDANDDGTVTVADFNLVTDMLLGIAGQTPTADCTGDALVSVHDLVCINSKLGQGRPTVVNQTVFVYDEQGQLLGEYGETGAPMQETVWLGNIPVAVIKSGNVYYVYADHLHTPRAITNTAGTVAWEWKSDAFGTTAANDDADGDGQRFVYNLRFPGQYFDPETGLHYNYFRDYNPQTGRYVQSDPIGLKGGLNTFPYVGGNPINVADASGTCPWCIPLIVLELWNIYDSANDAVETANTLADECATDAEKWSAIGLLGLGILDPTPGNLSKKGLKALGDLFKNGRTPKASELKQYAESQGWKPTQTENGPLKYIDENGISRVTIKQGSSRAPGSGSPHVELKDATGRRVDPFGNPVTRKSPGNHAPIDYDL